MRDPRDNDEVTDTMTQALARRAWFVFRVNLRDAVGYDGFEGNDFNLTGSGVEILHTVLDGLIKHPRGRFLLDYGDMVEDPIEVGPTNVESLLDAFEAVYGITYKPEVSDPARHDYKTSGIKTTAGRQLRTTSGLRLTRAISNDPPTNNF